MKKPSSGDVWRQRALLLSLVVTAGLSAAGATLALGSTGARSVGPLALPHQRAKVACASCHTTADAPATCGGCHDPAQHTSTRKAHRTLMEKGVLRCATCHPAHGDAYGVAFTGSGPAKVFHADAVTEVDLGSLPKGTTVPLVRVERCAGCHDAKNASDPIARCRDASGFSRCWDEHETPLAPRGATGVCKSQHGETRYVAWEAAGRVTKADVPTGRDRGGYEGLALPTSLASVLAGALAYVLVSRRGRRRGVTMSAATPAFAPPVKRLPVVNPVTCLGCYACVDACPFDVLEIKQYVAVVARPKDCTGVVLCEPACPNGSLVIHEGEAQEGALRIDDHGESLDAPGLFVAGDLTGLPLIKNAIAQGARVIARIRERRKELARDADVDVVIVGAGPAGLSAALSAKESKLSVRLFEQGDLAASIRAFPRDKLVFDAPLSMPIEGPLEFQSSTKDELVRAWERIVRKYNLDVIARTRVLSIVRDGDAFRVTARRASGEENVVRCRAVVLATGKYGSPRPFEADVVPSAVPHVHRFLSDARTFEGKRVVVVGLGDSAMEAAVALAKQPDTKVTLVHRGTDFARGRKRNIDEVRHLHTRGLLSLRFSTFVRKVEPGLVHLVRVGGDTADIVEADAVLVLIGGEPAWALAEGAGLRRVENFSADRTSEIEPDPRGTT